MEREIQFVFFQQNESGSSIDGYPRLLLRPFYHFAYVNTFIDITIMLMSSGLCYNEKL